jgi:prepilin-type N-terminal cleavage/methylation domain-containing protein
MLKGPIRLLRGLTLLELMVGLVILGGVAAMAAPAMGTWMTNARIRSTSEAMASGLRLAKAEALSRNESVRFQLTDTLTNACTLSASGLNWVINLSSAGAPTTATSKCAQAISDTADDKVLFKRPGAEGSTGISVSAVNTAATPAATNLVVFDGLGRASTALILHIRDTDADTNCKHNSTPGAYSCLRVMLSKSGQVRTCNPALSSPDPQAC